MRSRASILSLGLLLLGSLGAAPTVALAAQGASPAPPEEPSATPRDPIRAAEAGREAGSRRTNRSPTGVTAEGSVAGLAAEAAGSQVTYRVYATQYQPAPVADSVEVAVPDKCVKFAALGQSSLLTQFGCPSGYALGLDYRVVISRENGRSAVLPVKEVGPWNLDDNYWDGGAGSPRPRRLFTDLPRGTPEAQAAFYQDYNLTPNCKDLHDQPTARTDGADQKGRCVLNPAGVDLSFAAAAQLGLAPGQNEWVNVTFLWETTDPGSKPAIARNDLRHLRQSRSTGTADFSYRYGVTGDTPLMGDWDGNGTKTPAVFRNGTWYLRNSNSTGVADITLGYGNPTDRPVVGDWNGDGRDTPGVFRSGTWYLRNSNTTGVADIILGFGDHPDKPVVGDWNADGRDTPGVFRSGTWYLRNSNTTGVADITLGYGDPNDVPVVGDWNADRRDTPGVFRAGTWYLRNSNTTGVADLRFGYGDAGDRPLVWN